MPQSLEVLLPANSPLTELEFELHGQESIPFGCRSGACGACIIEVVSGAEALGARAPSERDFLASLGFDGGQFRLACQCRLMGDAVVTAIATP
ncbi:2Fe-2S iron-sulfur cluster binding domain-containing protein [Caballeronia catudaia]|nr:2Fe-2S iron-sulfur cluster-binding protein [Caballeronia catudaia]